MLAGVLAGVGLTGTRAAHYAAQAMPRHLQGLDLVVTGRVASLPRRTELGERFDLVVETATRAGQPVALPGRLQLSWYGGAAAAFEETSEGARNTPGLRTGDR